MALLKYLKPVKDCLPDPKGSLAGSVPPRIITSDKTKQKGEVLTISK